MNKPNSRHEMLLQAIAQGKECNLIPSSREEMYLIEHAKREACGGSGGSSGVGFDFVLRKDYPDNMWVDGDIDKVFSRLEKDCSIGLFVGYCEFTGEGYASGISEVVLAHNIGEPSAHIEVRTKYASYQVARDGTVTID